MIERSEGVRGGFPHASGDDPDCGRAGCAWGVVHRVPASGRKARGSAGAGFVRTRPMNNEPGDGAGDGRSSREAMAGAFVIGSPDNVGRTVLGEEAHRRRRDGVVCGRRMDAAMRMVRTQALRGPNIWTRRTCLEAWVSHVGSAEGDIPPEQVVDQLEQILGSALLQLAPVEPSPLVSGIDREPHPWSIVLARLTVSLLRDAGASVEYCLAVPTAADEDRVVVEYQDEEVGLAALELARSWLTGMSNGEEIPHAEGRKQLRRTHQKIAMGPSTSAIVQALTRRGIPHLRLNQSSLVQAGYGCRQRRFRGTTTDQTKEVGQAIAKDKDMTRQLLQAALLPVPKGRQVFSAEDAWEAAQELGLPVVVKPCDGNQGKGVSTRLTTREQVVAAYESARAVSRLGEVVVERFAEGVDFRVLVVGERVVAAARREPAHVVGDGAHTIAELVEIENRNQLRGEDHATPLSKLVLDEVSLAVLASQSLTRDVIPPAGQTVFIRRNANLSTGGTATDVTDQVCPDVAQVCVDAASIVGLDIAGIDLVARDLGRPLEEQGGVVVEVNASPGLRMHLHPTAGTPRAVGEDIAELLFPRGRKSRIPIAAVTGVNGKTTVTRLIARLMRRSGLSVGFTCTDGVYVNGQRVKRGDCSGPASARELLINPELELVVLETARGGLMRAGLGFDQCDVAVITNIGQGDHLGMADILTREQLAWVKGTLIANVAPEGTAVLNAADWLVMRQAHRCPGSTMLFGITTAIQALYDQIDAGERAVTVCDGEIVYFDGGRRIPLIGLGEVPITHGGSVRFQVENVLAAAAAALALGIDRSTLREGLVECFGELNAVPGRFNLLVVRGASVVVDYGHNVSSLEAVLSALEPLAGGRRLVVYTAAGDRRDEDILKQASMLGDFFDHVYLYEAEYLRGRPRGEIIALFRRGLAEARRTSSILEFPGEQEAVKAALDAVSDGDLLLLQADTVDDTVNAVRAYLDNLEEQSQEVPVAEPEDLAGAYPLPDEEDAD